MVDPLFNFVAAYFVGGFLLVSGVHKLRDRPAFADTVAAYRLLPNGLLAPTSLLLPAAELAVGAILFLPFAQPIAGAAAALLFAVYTAAMGINLLRGRTHIDCGCSLRPSGSRISPLHLMRNAMFIALALTTMLPASARSLAWLDLIQTMAALGVAALLYLGAETLLSNRDMMERRT